MKLEKFDGIMRRLTQQNQCLCQVFIVQKNSSLRKQISYMYNIWGHMNLTVSNYLCCVFRELHMQTCDWFYTGVKQKFKRFGSAKVVRSLYKRKTDCKCIRPCAMFSVSHTQNCSLDTVSNRCVTLLCIVTDRISGSCY